MESVCVKPPQKRHFKYGYNPYFPQMTRTQRRCWLRQQMYKSQEPRQTPESSNDAPLNKAKAIKVEIPQKGGILTSKYVKTSPSAIWLIGNETSMQKPKVTIICSKECLNQSNSHKVKWFMIYLKKRSKNQCDKITRNQRDVQVICGLIEWMITQSLYTLQEGQKTK